jgi:hypothetical protein
VLKVQYDKHSGSHDCNTRKILEWKGDVMNLRECLERARNTYCYVVDRDGVKLMQGTGEQIRKSNFGQQAGNAEVINTMHNMIDKSKHLIIKIDVSYEDFVKYLGSGN